MSAQKNQKLSELKEQNKDKDKAKFIELFLKEKKFKQWLTKEPNFSLVENDGFKKIQCQLNGHEMKLCVDTFKLYLQSKNYLKQAERKINPRDYEPFLVPHFRRENYLYCLFTKKTLICDKALLEKHTQGRRFSIKLNKFWNDERKKGRMVLGKLQYCHNQIKKMDASLADKKITPELKKSCTKKMKIFCKEYTNHSRSLSKAVSSRKNLKMVLAAKIKLCNLKRERDIRVGKIPM